jgi:hypothetical protein
LVSQLQWPLKTAARRLPRVSAIVSRLRRSVAELPDALQQTEQTSGQKGRETEDNGQNGKLSSRVKGEFSKTR